MRANVIYALVVGALVFVPLERVFALHREQKILRRGWRTDIIHFLFTRTLSDICTFLFVGTLILLVHWLVSPSFQAMVAAQNRLLQFAEAALIANVGGYVGHRLSHEVPFLWRFHSVHHSISEMDWLAAARVHPLDQIVTKALTIVPLYILGFSKATFGAYIGLATFHAVFIHANVRFKFGPLRWLIGTPAFHHWHHSAEPEARNKNFAGELPLLDFLFGTFYLPKGRMPERYGTSEPVPVGYFGQILHPFRNALAVSGQPCRGGTPWPRVGSAHAPSKNTIVVPREVIVGQPRVATEFTSRPGVGRCLDKTTVRIFADFRWFLGSATPTRLKETTNEDPPLAVEYSTTSYRGRRIPST